MNLNKKVGFEILTFSVSVRTKVFSSPFSKYIILKIFAMPGMGRQILDAINKREYATVQSSIMIFAIMFVLINLITDIIYRRIDPRIK